MSTWDPAGGAEDLPAQGTPPQAELQQQLGLPFPGRDPYADAGKDPEYTGQGPETPDPVHEAKPWGDEAGEYPYEQTGYAVRDWPGWGEAGTYGPGAGPDSYEAGDEAGIYGPGDEAGSYEAGDEASIYGPGDEAGDEAGIYGPGDEAEYENSYAEGHGYGGYAGEPWPYPLYGSPGGTPGNGAALSNRARSPAKGRPSGPWPGLVMVTSAAVIVAAIALGVTSANRDKLTSSRSPAVPTSAAGEPASSGGPRANTAGANTTRLGRPSRTRAPRASASAPGPRTSAPARPTKTRPPRVLAKNLIIPAPVKRQLVETWVATDPGGLGLTTKDVAGTVRGEVYYGYDVSIATYFAIAAFQPSPLILKRASTALGQAELREFKGTEYVFSLQTGSIWTELGMVATGECPGEWVPTAVLAVWGMCGLRPPAT